MCAANCVARHVAAHLAAQQMWVHSKIACVGVHAHTILTTTAGCIDDSIGYSTISVMLQAV